MLSALSADTNTQRARACLNGDLHLISSLVCAEFYASLARMTREQVMTATQRDSAALLFESGVWTLSPLSPDIQLFESLSRRLRLRGADLWHVAMLETLRQSVPDLALLTFDQAMRDAAVILGLPVVA